MSKFTSLIETSKQNKAEKLFDDFTKPLKIDAMYSKAIVLKVSPARSLSYHGVYFFRISVSCKERDLEEFGLLFCMACYASDLVDNLSAVVSSKRHNFTAN